ncbi:MAG TPA: serine/threonine-protein kinase, partial [Rhodothermia bacterium]|nr:serine/threonine-protein kinase [Rhodothermia bacterium]
MKDGAIISHYEILSRLGGGGMGVVYKARDTKLGRTVALKFLPPELSTDREANERFVVEAQAASALDHNNICTIYEIGETDDGQLFIAMTFYEGKTLKYWLLEKGRHLDTVGREGSGEAEALDASSGPPFEENEVLKIVRQVALGLAAAHEKGIIHRDVKPANIMVTDKGRAVILDFGLAKLPGALSLTQTGSTLGTAAYMAPEQVRGEAVDGRTDIWSLGVVFYEMLTGHRPFVADYQQALSYAILNQDVGEPEGATAEATTIVMRMLAKDPNDRFPNVEALIQEIDAVLDARHTPSGRAAPAARQKKRPGLQIAIGAGAAIMVIVA